MSARYDVLLKKLTDAVSTELAVWSGRGIKEVPATAQSSFPWITEVSSTAASAETTYSIEGFLSEVQAICSLAEIDDLLPLGFKDSPAFRRLRELGGALETRDDEDRSLSIESLTAFATYAVQRSVREDAFLAATADGVLQLEQESDGCRLVLRFVAKDRVWLSLKGAPDEGPPEWLAGEVRLQRLGCKNVHSASSVTGGTTWQAKIERQHGSQTLATSTASPILTK